LLLHISRHINFRIYLKLDNYLLQQKQISLSRHHLINLNLNLIQYLLAQMLLLM
jgi:hypothetical protein